MVLKRENVVMYYTDKYKKYLDIVANIAQLQ
jgi:hypothetical protein